MDKIPRLFYSSLARLWAYGSRDLNGKIADDKSLEVMLRIEKTMQRLEVMGDDDRRYLWIRLKAPDKRYRRRDADQQGYYWAQVLTAHYKGFHYLLLDDPMRHYKMFDLRSSSGVYSDREDESPCGRIDVETELLKLERYVTRLVDKICKDPKSYSDYVEANLPYEHRKGKIRRSELNKMLPCMRMFDDNAQALDILHRQKSLPIWYSDTMNLRIYMKFWRIAYDEYRKTFPDNGFFRHEPTDGMTDEEVFRRHSSKGSEIDGLNLESEEDFLKWESTNSSFHCNDVAYARIHLHARKKEREWDKTEGVPDGRWYFSLSYHAAGYSEDTVKILGALIDAGVNVTLWPAERLWKMAEESDYVTITPYPNKYSFNEESGNDISLPDEKREEIIRATRWEKQHEAIPLKVKR